MHQFARGRRHSHAADDGMGQHGFGGRKDSGAFADHRHSFIVYGSGPGRSCDGLRGWPGRPEFLFRACGARELSGPLYVKRRGESSPRHSIPASPHFPRSLRGSHVPFHLPPDVFLAPSFSFFLCPPVTCIPHQRASSTLYFVLPPPSPRFLVLLSYYFVRAPSPLRLPQISSPRSRSPS